MSDEKRDRLLEKLIIQINREQAREEERIRNTPTAIPTRADLERIPYRKGRSPKEIQHAIEQVESEGAKAASEKRRTKSRGGSGPSI